MWMLRSMGGAVSRSLQKQFGVKRSEAQVASGTWRPHCVKKKGCSAPIAFGSSFFPFFLSFFLSHPRRTFRTLAVSRQKMGQQGGPLHLEVQGVDRKLYIEVLVLKKKTCRRHVGKKLQESGVPGDSGVPGVSTTWLSTPGFSESPGTPEGTGRWYYALHRRIFHVFVLPTIAIQRFRIKKNPDYHLQRISAIPGS